MAVLTFAAALVLIGSQIALYARQRRRHPEIAGAARPEYPVSRLTRCFGWMKLPLYLIVIADLGVRALPGGGSPLPPAVVALGLACAAAGLCLLASSLNALGACFAPCDRGVLPPERIRSGPYRVLAHPIYAANLLLVGGLGLASGSPVVWGVALLLGLVYAAAIRDEERALARHWPRKGEDPRRRGSLPS